MGEVGLRLAIGKRESTPGGFKKPDWIQFQKVQTTRRLPFLTKELCNRSQGGRKLQGFFQFTAIR